jgi:3-hydroxyacyl-CoA dehydrogenase/enoyl-CoA hydratase/3-hydroxybutyryl-CoA epimerase
MTTPDIGIRFRVDDDGVAWVVFDRAGDKVNLLTPEILDALGGLLNDWKIDENVRGVVFTSSKPGMFIAGMDVQQIAAVTEAFKAAEGARFGQAVFQKIAELGKPSACAIGGVCLGGGTEMALACTFRLASDDPRMRIGLPEVQIGIVPGFGGTQRMPRLVGLVPSLDLILTGRKLNAKQARKIGLVDEVVPSAYLDRVAGERVRAASGASRPPRRRPLTMQAMEKIGPLRNMVLSRARKKTAAKASPKNYPAPFRALDAIEGAYTFPIEQGLDLEARIVGELVPTPTSKNLIWLFKSQSALTRTESFTVPPRKVRKAAVLGAGVMGGGISQLLANREIAVRLKDIRQDAVLSALQTAAGLWSRQVKRRRLSSREAYQKMANIAPTLDTTGLRRVDLVIEAVVEDLEIKRKVLAELEERLDERAVFASNTSSLPITDIAAKALRPERVVGMHFFNPVHRMPLVEVIAGQKSSPEAVATVHALATRLGKTPVIVRDTPGFLVNRILMVYMNEALQLLGEGVRIDAADRAMTAFGMPMGAFALLDQVGLDTAHHVAGVLQEAFGDRIGPPSPILGTLVSAGKLGVKNGRGFYRYSRGRRTEPDTDTYNLAATPDAREVPAETLEERMVLAMVNEAAVCLEHGVVREPRDVDVSMVMGTGFPPFRGGLLRHADAAGIPIVVDRLSRLADAHGERFRPAGLLNQMVRGQRRFYRD